MDRLEIIISGDLPDVTKFAILAAAQEAANELASKLADRFAGTEFQALVKAVRPGKKKGAQGLALRAAAE